jgi:hypothetical protein
VKKIYLLAIMCTLFAIATKPNSYDAKTIAGTALITTGLVSAYISNKLWVDSFEEKLALSRELINNANQRHKKNFLKFYGSFLAGVTSYAATVTGLLLLSDSKATGATLLANGLVGLYHTRNRINQTKKQNELDEKFIESLPSIPNLNREKFILTNSNKTAAVASIVSTTAGLFLLGYNYFPKLNNIKISNYFNLYIPFFPTCFGLNSCD